MRIPHRLLVASASCALAACGAPNPPLVFADSATIGLGLGNDAATAGASATLGYKHRSVAIVPVSVLYSDGKASPIKGYGAGPLSEDKFHDALSVFAVFDASSAQSQSQSGSNAVRVGQIFSTGAAAQALTRGYGCKLAGNCGSSNPAAALAAAAASRAAGAAVAAANAAKASAVVAQSAARGSVAQSSVAGAEKASPAATASDRPYQSPLVYARTDVFGLDIGGAVAEQGMQFTMGYRTRNLALIPVVMVGAGGWVTKLVGGDMPANADDKPDVTDSFSVLGQFKADTETRKVSFGFERFFATGVAAQHLAHGMEESIQQQRTSTTAKTVPNGTKVADSVPSAAE